MPDLLERLRSALSDRYAVESEIGRGGMAVVFLAQDLKHHRQVAIKVLDPTLSAKLGADRFLNEIQIAARLDHPHIVPLYDSGRADDLLFYVMPFVSGESLRERLDREKQLPIDDALRIVAEVADGLAYAHEHGIVHRDVKPGNVLLSAGHARIADFGVARAIDLASGSRGTEAGLAVGTPLYMAPEQASGQERGDERSDIYSVGCLLYEVLVGEPPYTGLTPQTLQARKMSESAPRIGSVRDTVSPRVEEIVARAIARIPADRYQTALDLKTALEKPDHGLQAMPARARSSAFGNKEQVHRKLAMITVVLLLAISLGYAGMTVFDSKRDSASAAPEIRSLVVLPLENRSEDPDQEYLADGMTDALTAALSGLGAFERVISISSAMTYKDANMPAVEIARELNVDAVMEGVLSRAAEGERVALQLVHGPTGRQLWSGEYVADLNDVFGFPERVSRDVAEGIRLTLLPPEQTRFTPSAYTSDPRAIDAYWRGRQHSVSYSPARAQLARDYYEEAVELNPHFAPAQAALALNLCVMLPSLTADRDEMMSTLTACESAAHRALDLDEGLSEAHSALALAKVTQWDWAGADSEFKRAIELDPNSVTAHLWYGWFLAQMMRLEEALLEARRAEELDPHNPLVKTFVVATLMNQHRYADAHAQLDEILKTNPNDVGALIYKAAILNLQKVPDQALEYTSRLPPVMLQAMGLRAWSYALKGQDEQALDLVAQIGETMGDQGAGSAAIVYTALGREDEALDRLERGYHAHAPWLPTVLSWPHFDALRDHPRFQDLRRRMGLE